MLLAAETTVPAGNGLMSQTASSQDGIQLTGDANRVQDILTALAYMQDRAKAQTVNLAGLELGGVWSYFARAMAGPNVSLTADLAQFRVDQDEEYMQRFYIPGLRKAGDFRAAAVLNSGSRLLLHNRRLCFWLCYDWNHIFFDGLLPGRRLGNRVLFY